MNQNGPTCAGCAYFSKDAQDLEGKWVFDFGDHRNGICAGPTGAAHFSLDELPHNYPACSSFEGRYDPATRACETCQTWQRDTSGLKYAPRRTCRLPKPTNSPVHCKNWKRRSTPLKEAAHA